MYRIKELSELSKDKKLLTEYSGYCMIYLIANIMGPKTHPVDEDMLADAAFFEYDYAYRDNRPPNGYYIRAAHDYLRKAGIGSHDIR